MAKKESSESYYGYTKTKLEKELKGIVTLFFLTQYGVKNTHWEINWYFLLAKIKNTGNVNVSGHNQPLYETGIIISILNNVEVLPNNKILAQQLSNECKEKISRQYINHSIQIKRVEKLPKKKLKRKTKTKKAE